MSDNDRLTKEQMLTEYEVIGFFAYLCVVKRRSDGVKGCLDFYTDDGVRYYHNFVSER